MKTLISKFGFAAALFVGLSLNTALAQETVGGYIPPEQGMGDLPPPGPPLGGGAIPPPSAPPPPSVEPAPLTVDPAMAFQVLLQFAGLPADYIAAIMWGSATPPPGVAADPVVIPPPPGSGTRPNDGGSCNVWQRISYYPYWKCVG